MAAYDERVWLPKAAVCGPATSVHNAKITARTCVLAHWMHSDRSPHLDTQELQHLVGIDLDPIAHKLAGDRLQRELAKHSVAAEPAPAAGTPGSSSGDSKAATAVHLLRGNYRCAGVVDRPEAPSP